MQSFRNRLVAAAKGMAKKPLFANKREKVEAVLFATSASSVAAFVLITRHRSKVALNQRVIDDAARQEKIDMAAAEASAAMDRAVIARDSMFKSCEQTLFISKMSLWEMYTLLPHTEADLKRRLIEDNNRDLVAPLSPYLENIRRDYLVALATLSKDNFYTLAPILFHRNIDAASEKEYLPRQKMYNDALFRDLFYLIRDIHDEHDYHYRSKHVVWPGGFDDTRAAIQGLMESPLVDDAIKAEPHIVREFKRISDPANDLVGRNEQEFYKMQSRIAAANAKSQH